MALPLLLVIGANLWLSWRRQGFISAGEIVTDLVMIGLWALGISVYLFATRRLFANPGDARYEHFIARFGTVTKILSVVMLVLGAVRVLARL